MTQHTVGDAAGPEAATASLPGGELGDDDRCEISHPSLPEIRCVMPVGHGGPHRSSTQADEGYEWN